MPDEFKMQSEHLKGYNEKQEGVETSDTHPLKEMDKNFQVTPKDSHRKASLPEGPAEIGVKPEKTSDPNLKENTPFSRGVSLSPAPQLNGFSDGVWKIIKENPDDVPAKLANKIYASVGINLTGSQIKAMITQVPSQDDQDDFDF